MRKLTNFQFSNNYKIHSAQTRTSQPRDDRIYEPIDTSSGNSRIIHRNDNSSHFPRNRLAEEPNINNDGEMFRKLASNNQ